MTHHTFHGATFDYTQDFFRLKKQLDKLAWLMRDGKPRTIPEVAQVIDCSQTSASARLRDLRKPAWRDRYGIEEVVSNRVEGGLWKYHVTYKMDPKPCA